MEFSTIKESEALPENEAIDSLAFGWWNTSLSPVGKNRSDEHHKSIAINIVKSLINELRIDCLALGEITNDDLTLMVNACDSETLSTYEGTLKTGRLQFDTGIIYNNSRFLLSDSTSFTNSHGTRNYKVANRVDFVSQSDGVPIHVFVSHWPSRTSSEENLLSRKTIASRLKEQLDILSANCSNPAVIVMGDFNDEPFDESLSWHLLATRDRHLAKTKDGYLYNPFWRHLGESQPHSRFLSKTDSAGSCFYRSSSETRWRTFDQMLFSSALLGKSPWHLNESKTMILRTEFLINLIQNDGVHFDHLPIISVIEKFKPQD